MAARLLPVHTMDASVAQVRPRAHGSLFRKYALYFGGLVSAALLATGLLTLWSSYFEARALVDALYREKADGAATRIEQFVRVIEGQLRAALIVHEAGIVQGADELHLELIRLMRQAPAVSDVAWIDADGRQQVRVSRTARDEIGAGPDRSGEDAVQVARTGTLHTGPVYFRHGSEPFVTLAVAAQAGGRAGQSRSGAVLVADVNLKLVWEVISAIRIGASGLAYVVDRSGLLIAHPDIGLVLRKSDVSMLEQVRHGLSAAGTDVHIAPSGVDGRHRRMVVAHAAIPALGWHVFVEQVLTEAFAPLASAAIRIGVTLVAGVVLAIVIALALARRMSAPIRALQAGAVRIGEGRLEERVSLQTRDELQDLAEQFNRMAERLRESYEGLEAKIDERTRQLAAANDAKSRFLAAASHDLRQPAHALGLFLAQMDDTTAPDEQARLLGRVRASSAAVCELLDALFDISSLDAGKVSPRMGRCDVQSIFNRIEQHYAAAAREQDLRLRIRPTVEHVSSDPVLLERIVLNLVANAVRYTREGGVLVGCRRRGDRVRIEVWDTGIGIAAADRERIFEEFTQAHGPLGAGQAKGLGLGLAIVRRLAALVGVAIEFDSVPGRGSVFACVVPLDQSPPAEAMPRAAPAGAGAAGLAGLHALVIDDDRDAREAVAGLLGRWGCRVTSEAGGDAAIATMAREPGLRFDVIVSDFRLADGELGTDTIARVRAAMGRPVPALIVSGDAGEAARVAGGDESIHVLAKPVEAARMRALLHYLVADRGEVGVTPALRPRASRPD